MVNILPLVMHEMRASVRRPTAYRIRLAAGGATIGLSCWGLLVWSDSMTAASLGHSLLRIFGGTGFIGGALAGLVLTSDCISQERRDVTLGLLFLTDLRGHDITIGKLAAKGITPFYCLLAMFPSLTVCVIVGGVTAGEVWRLSLVLLNTLFFSLALTILTSTFCRRQRAAQAGALLAILLSMVALPLLGAGFSSGTGGSLAHPFHLLFSPAASYFLAFDAGYRVGPGWFWGSLLTTHLAVIHALFKILVGADASHEFAASRLNGTLELLLATPLQAREVAAGMLSAYRRRFLGPLFALLLSDAMLAAKLFFANNRSGAFIVGAGAAMLLADAYCLCWVGLWRGLLARDSVRAILATLWRILVLPWLYFAAGFGIFHQSTLAQFAGLWAFLGSVNDVVFLLNAKDFFIAHFRAMALRPFGEKPQRVESKWSPMNWEAELKGEAKVSQV